MTPFIRRVRTASGATAVQIVEKRSGMRRIVAHIGSAHDESELAVLMAAAREQLVMGQSELDLGLDSAASNSPRVVSWSSQVLWDVLHDAYEKLGFTVVKDDAFETLVLARLVEPTSKADTIRVLADLGVPSPHLNTLFAALKRCNERDYRDVISKACVKHRANSGMAAMVMYDVTTLHFEAEKEDELRKVGMSKERRVDPQVQVGLLVDPSGFPLEIYMFEGNKAETKTLIPVLATFQKRHGIKDVVVVADAGMLSAANLNALEAASFSFIVGSRISKAPYDLAEHFSKHGNYFKDMEILESTRLMGTGKNQRSRRIIYQYKFKREQHDNRAINAMVDRADKIASGASPMAKARFVKVTGATKALDDTLIERARQLAGLKGYVTNLDLAQMDGQAVIDAYHQLYQVERSFRMTKSDLRARPVFHHQRDAIEAHLTIVFAALAIGRYLQAATGASIKKVVQTLRPLRTVKISVDGHIITAKPTITPDAREVLSRLPVDNAPGH